MFWLEYEIVQGLYSYDIVGYDRTPSPVADLKRKKKSRGEPSLTYATVRMSAADLNSHNAAALLVNWSRNAAALWHLVTAYCHGSRVTATAMVQSQ